MLRDETASYETATGHRGARDADIRRAQDVRRLTRCEAPGCTRQASVLWCEARSGRRLARALCDRHDTLERQASAERARFEALTRGM